MLYYHNVSQPKRETKASRALTEALTPKLTQEELAERLGVTQQAVSSWANGRTKPSAEVMAKIEDLLGISMRSWVESAVKSDDAGDSPAPTGTGGR